MPTWIAPGNGTWTDPANWSGGVPSAAGSTASFSFATNAGGTIIIGIPEFADIRVGVMNINMTGTTGITIRGSLTDSGADIGDLIFDNGASTAQLNVATLSTTSPTTFSSAAGLRMTLASDLNVNVVTAGSVARFDLPVSGAGTLIKSGVGTLELNATNSMSGGIEVTGGVLDAFADSALGSGAVTISNNSTFRSAGTVNNTIGTLSNITGTAGSAQIVAAAATTMTLTGTLSHISQGAVNFGSATDSGTIVACFGSILENATNSSLRIAGGTLRLGNAFNAANLLSHPGAGLTEIQNGGILDTNGLAAVISNLDFDDGTIRSSTGVLNVTVNDVFVANNAQNGTLEGTAGADTFTINTNVGFSLSGMSFVSWTAGIDTITINGSAGANTLIGSTQRDTINGLDGNDTLFGGAGNDTLNGGAGNDILTGEAGIDTFVGGAGDDTFNLDDAAELVFESLGEGTDTVNAGFSHYLFANVENLVLSGAANLFGVGNDLANTLTGNTGINLLLGGGGNDTIHGAAGNDQLFGEGGNDTLNGDAGIDYIAGGLDNDSIFGGADPDELFGEDGDDLLDGGDSFHTDIMTGGTGNDILDGVSGQTNPDFDLMDGGTGNDTYFVDTGDDLTFEGVGGGTDTVHANVTVPNAGVYLYANVENLVLQGTTAFGVGNELANNLTGSASGNWLLGGLGNDRIAGLAGNDVLFGEGGADTFVFGAGSGQDVIGDFAIAQDVIEFASYFTSFAQAQANFVQVGANGAINLGGGNLIVLHGVTMANLTAANFTFVASAAEAPKAAVPVMEGLSFGFEPADAYAGHGLSRWQAELQAEPIYG